MWPSPLHHRLVAFVWNAWDAWDAWNGRSAPLHLSHQCMGGQEGRGGGQGGRGGVQSGVDDVYTLEDRPPANCGCDYMCYS